jgi:hypothetical protein
MNQQLKKSIQAIQIATYDEFKQHIPESTAIAKLLKFCHFKPDSGTILKSYTSSTDELPIVYLQMQNNTVMQVLIETNNNTLSAREMISSTDELGDLDAVQALTKIPKQKIKKKKSKLDK